MLESESMKVDQSNSNLITKHGEKRGFNHDNLRMKH